MAAAASHAASANPRSSSLAHFRHVGKEFGNRTADRVGLLKTSRKTFLPPRSTSASAVKVTASTASFGRQFLNAFGLLMRWRVFAVSPHWIRAGIGRSSRASWRKYPAAQRTELDDLLLAVGARRDGKAFAELFDHLRPRVHAQLMRLGLAPAAAEDLTQDVMETIWRKAHLYDPRQSAAITWVFQLARNRRIDLRRRTREQCFALENFFAIPDPAAGSDDCFDAARLQTCVRVALRALPHEQFTLVQLAFFDGLSHSAIAERLNLPLGTVKSRLRLAFTRLHRALTDAGLTKTCILG
jgi:RNA polymerase sigma factor (sigma-70 family)